MKVLSYPTFCILFIISLFESHAQSISISGINTDSITSILQAQLQNDCVEILNATYTGSLEAIGLFTTPAGSSFPLDKGILLTTGKASLAAGPNTNTHAGFDNHKPGEPLLTTLGYQNTFDAATIDFDFVVHSDSIIKIEYIFGSEEYSTGAQNEINDMMGIFITGQNLPFQNPYFNWNIATVPGTNQSVCVYMVNSNMYPEFYNENSFNSNEAIQYNGYTSVLTATALILPCSTYHIKISVADALDYSYDSGIFLKFKSLSTEEIDSYSLYDFALLNDTIMNGCPIQLRATKADSSLLNDTVTIEPILGENGLLNNAYPVANNFYILPGVMTLDFETPTFPNSQAFNHQYHVSHPTCHCFNRHELFTILGTNSLASNILPSDTLLCGSTVNLDALIPFTYPDSLDYQWSDGSSSSNTSFSPTEYESTLIVTVSDGCSKVVTDEITVYSFDFAPDLLPDSIPLINQIAQLNAFEMSGASYNWSTGAQADQITVTETGTYTLTISTDCGDITDEVIVYQPIGIEENTESDLLISPNPAKDYFEVSIPHEAQGIRWELLSIEGKKVLSGISSEENFRIDVQRLPYGVYLFSMQGEKYLRASRLIIHQEY